MCVCAHSYVGKHHIFLKSDLTFSTQCPQVQSSWNASIGKYKAPQWGFYWIRWYTPSTSFRWYQRHWKQYRKKDRKDRVADSVSLNPFKLGLYHLSHLSSLRIYSYQKKRKKKKEMGKYSTWFLPYLWGRTPLPEMPHEEKIRTGPWLSSPQVNVNFRLWLQISN